MKYSVLIWILENMSKYSVSALTHITRIQCNFDVANSPQYHDDKCIFAAKFRKLCAKVEKQFYKTKEEIVFFITICNCSINFIK